MVREAGASENMTAIVLSRYVSDQGCLHNEASLGSAWVLTVPPYRPFS